MAARILASGDANRLFARLVLGLAVLGLPAQCLFAASCTVVRHNPPTEAGKALLASDYAKAESLYRADLAAHPNDTELTAGLVHTLLREQKVQEAADTVKTALDTAPNSAALITLRGEVEFRQGTPWLAGKSVNESGKLDPCSPRTYLLLADLARISSLYASAHRMLMTAHQLDPEDPEIRGEWMETLPIKQRIPEIEAYLATPTGDDKEDLRHLRMYLDHLKKMVDQPRRNCHLVSPVASTEIPFIKIMYDATRMRAFGLNVKLNDHNARLEIDTGASGLMVTLSLIHILMEPVEFPQRAIEPRQPEWAVAGTAETRGNLITSLHMDINDMEQHNRALEAKYRSAERHEARAEEWYAEGAEIVLVGYGIVGRILKAVTADARASGINVGVLRPITLYPFPSFNFQRLAKRARVFVVVEMSNGQLLEDVRLALNGARPVEFLNRMGGNVPSHDEVLAFVRELARRTSSTIKPSMEQEEERVAHV